MNFYQLTILNDHLEKGGISYQNEFSPSIVKHLVLNGYYEQASV